MRQRTKLIGGATALAVTFVGAWEGLRLTAYRDVAGIETVCYGETKGVSMTDSFTKAECDRMLLRSLKDHERGMRACLNDPDAIPLESYVAFVSLTYNIGVGAFCRSTARKRLDAGNLRGACQAATWYKRAGGRVVKGLINRRSAEYQMCVQGANGT